MGQPEYWWTVLPQLLHVNFPSLWPASISLSAERFLKSSLIVSLLPFPPALDQIWSNLGWNWRCQNNPREYLHVNLCRCTHVRMHAHREACFCIIPTLGCVCVGGAVELIGSQTVGELYLTVPGRTMELLWDHIFPSIPQSVKLTGTIVLQFLFFANLVKFGQQIKPHN